jgi:hypothetical protein
MVDFAAGLSLRYREDLRYRMESGRLRNHLTKRVPVIGARTATEVSSRLLARHGLSRNDIAWWVAHHGRIDVLFVAIGVQVWGGFDLEKDKVYVHESPELDDEDLLDLAAIQTLIKEGAVYAVSPAEFLDKALVAAVLRY